jgi:hypothetical protein
MHFFPLSWLCVISLTTVIIDIPNLLIRISYIRLLKKPTDLLMPACSFFVVYVGRAVISLFRTTYGLSCVLFAQIRLIACLYFQTVCQSTLVGLFLLQFPIVQCKVVPLVTAGTELFGIIAIAAKPISYATTIGLKQKNFSLASSRYQV